MRRHGARAVLLAALLGAAACGGPSKEAPAKREASSRLATPFPLEPIVAFDLDGRDVSSATWKAKVVIVNFCATWCGPCRREMPALAALQDKYRDRLLVIGVLDDNVTDDFAREFGRTVKLNYPVVRSTPEIEHRFPTVLALPMTFIIDTRTNLVAMFAGEVDAAALEAEVVRVLRGGGGLLPAAPPAG